MVIATDVACRAGPGTGQDAVASLRVGELLSTTDSLVAEDGTWYQFRAPRLYGPCWALGTLTTRHDPHDPGRSLLAVADHLLARGQAAEFEEYVAVENLLRHPHHPLGEALASSPLLQLRLLQIVHGAAWRIDTFETRRDPLLESWVLSHAGQIKAWGPSGSWTVGAERFWELYERYPRSEEAEEIAWVASNHPNPRECEGSSECYLEMILDGPLQYWTRFRRGGHLEEALDQATRLAEEAADGFCGGGAGEGDRIAELLIQIRVSIMNLRADGRGPFDDMLRGVDGKCREERTPG